MDIIGMKLIRQNKKWKLISLNLLCSMEYSMYAIRIPAGKPLSGRTFVSQGSLDL